MCFTWVKCNTVMFRAFVAVPLLMIDIRAAAKWFISFQYYLIINKSQAKDQHLHIHGYLFNYKFWLMVPETQLHQTRIKYSNVASENQKWQSQKISDYVLQRRFARGHGDGRVMVNIITMAGPGRWVLREGDGHLDPPPMCIWPPCCASLAADSGLHWYPDFSHTAADRLV